MENQNQNREVLFSTDKFEVINKDGKVGIEPYTLTVAVLPFTRDGRGLPGQLGVLKEYNRIRSRESITAITGKAEGEDPDILTAAQRKLQERSGIDVQEPERWYFLGFMTTHKMINQEIPCFACDITGMSAPEEDTEDDEDGDASDKPEFILMGVNQALDTTDCFIPAIFMKIFKYIFGFSTGGDVDTSNNTNNMAAPVTEDPHQKEIMEIEGVVGAGMNDEDEWLIHVKADLDVESIKSKVESIVGDVAVNIEVTPELTNTDKE